jgi:hypothetical protein
MSKREIRTIAIDFDGTIVEHEFPAIGKIKEGAKEVINRLYEDYTIVISSCRTSRMFNGDGKAEENPKFLEMKRFLDDNGIKYDRIDMGDEGKVVAIAYIDDRGLRFTNWRDMLNYF